MFSFTIAVIVVVTCIILYFIRPPPYPSCMNGAFVGDAKDGETRVLRGYLGIEKVIDYTPQGYETIADIVNGMSQKNVPRLVGYRTMEKEIPFKTIKTTVNNKEVEKTLYKYQMSDYKWISSLEYQEMVNKLASGLNKNGFVKGDHIGIFCETRYEWLMFAMACCRQGIVAVTVYSTLGIEAVKIALTETHVKGVFVSEDTYDKIQTIAQDISEDLKIITIGIEPKTNTLQFEELVKTDIIPSFSSVEKDDLALIMYTSGTTSQTPKGVLVEQKQIIMLAYAYHNNIFFADDVLIAYLPLAHIFELCIEFSLIMFFGTIGYAGVRTLTTAGVMNCKSDLVALRPTILIGVPTVFNRVRKAILESVNQSAPFKKILFSWCFEIKMKLYVQYDLRPPLLFQPLLFFVDSILFKPLRNSLFGDRITSIIIGGSALSSDLQCFLNSVVPNTDIMQGFGMTELCGASCVMPHGDNSFSTIGVIFPHYEAKLRDVEDLGYSTSSNPPTGELLFRGVAVSKGYFNRPEETKQNFTEDGWCCTGDIASITDDLHIKIIDRKKNIVKQACGEYVSLEWVESKYSSCDLIDNICVFADSFHDFVIALIVPNRKQIEDFAQMDWEKAVEDQHVNDMMKEKLSLCEVGMDSRQKIKHFSLVADEWTPDNEMLTAAMKLKRHAISSHYRNKIISLWDKN
ncbi:Long-chain-fatty-acid--CoA ligase [Entamoeba marina]